MISLYGPIRQGSLPNTSRFCHHRLSVDYRELFNDSIRMSSNKCITRTNEPFFSNGSHIVTCAIYSREGFYKDITFNMEIIVSNDYPFVPPRIICSTKILHPNIDAETGEVAIAMLRQNDWIPVLNLNFILFALELVIIQPNISCIPNNQQNLELVRIYQTDLDLFENLIQNSQENMCLQNGDSDIRIDEEKDQSNNAPIFMNMNTLPNTTLNLFDSNVKSEGIVRSLRHDFEKHEIKKQEILNTLTETLLSFENNPVRKKKRKEQENLINPFLKKVRIGSS